MTKFIIGLNYIYQFIFLLIMRTSLKNYAISVLGNVYPESVVEEFKKQTTYRKVDWWLEQIQKPCVLRQYVTCLDDKPYGSPDHYTKNQRKTFAQNDITPTRLQCFHKLNLMLLESIISQTDDPLMSTYYRALLRLHDGTPILERDSLFKIAHQNEVKIIKHFIASQDEGIDWLSLRNFLTVAALFSSNKFIHTDETKLKLISLIEFFD